MTTILYGVCGEGLGHAVRSKAVIEHLLKKNKVIILASEKSYDFLSKKFDNVHLIEGLNLVYENNSLNYAKTFLNAFKNIPKSSIKNFIAINKLIKEHKPSIIFSDFEFSVNLISKIRRIPLISIDNQHIITKSRLKLARKYSFYRALTYFIISLCIMNPKRYLITTYFYPKLKDKRKIILFPPILRNEILRIRPYPGKHILVYQTSTTYEKLIPELKKVKEDFVVYGLNKDNKEDNIQFREFDEKQFFKDLASCRAVITNGGFTLIGEALQLNKPVLSIPVRKQIEQTINAIYLQRLGYGEFHDDIDKEIVENFLKKAPVYRRRLVNYKKNDNSKILKEIDKLVGRYTKR